MLVFLCLFTIIIYSIISLLPLIQISEIILFHGIGDLILPVLATVSSLNKAFTYFDLATPNITRIPVGAEALVLMGIQHLDDDRLMNLFRIVRSPAVPISSSSTTSSSAAAVTNIGSFSFTAASASTIKRIYVICPTIDIYTRARLLTSRLFSMVSISFIIPYMNCKILSPTPLLMVFLTGIYYFLFCVFYILYYR